MKTLLATSVCQQLKKLIPFFCCCRQKMTVKEKISNPAQE